MGCFFPTTTRWFKMGYNHSLFVYLIPHDDLFRTMLYSQKAPVALKQYRIHSREIIMIYIGIDVAKNKHDSLSSIQMVKYYFILLPSLTLVKVLNLYFRELNLYHMIYPK